VNVFQIWRLKRYEWCAGHLEFDEGEVVVRNMETSEQEKMKIGDLVNYFTVEQMNS
jgi:histidyl-tRNA synthetase